MGTIERPEGGTMAELEARRRALADELAAIGHLAHGSVIAVTTTCSTRGCHCRTDPARRHGPYWQWTRSTGGVARTRRLREDEARLLQGWIAERRRAEAILAEIEELSLRLMPGILAERPEVPEPAARRARRAPVRPVAE